MKYAAKPRMKGTGFSPYVNRPSPNPSPSQCSHHN